MELSFEPNETRCLIRKDIVYLGSLKCAGCKHFGKADLRRYKVTCNHAPLSIWKAIRNIFRARRQKKNGRKNRGKR